MSLIEKRTTQLNCMMKGVGTYIQSYLSYDANKLSTSEWFHVISIRKRNILRRQQVNVKLPFVNFLRDGLPFIKLTSRSFHHITSNLFRIDAKTNQHCHGNCTSAFLESCRMILKPVPSELAVTEFHLHRSRLRGKHFGATVQCHYKENIGPVASWVLLQVLANNVIWYCQNLS